MAVFNPGHCWSNDVHLLPVPYASVGLFSIAYGEIGRRLVARIGSASIFSSKRSPFMPAPRLHLFISTHAILTLGKRNSSTQRTGLTVA